MQMQGSLAKTVISVFSWFKSCFFFFFTVYSREYKLLFMHCKNGVYLFLQISSSNIIICWHQHVSKMGKIHQKPNPKNKLKTEFLKGDHMPYLIS